MGGFQQLFGAPSGGGFPFGVFASLINDSKNGTLPPNQEALNQVDPNQQGLFNQPYKHNIFEADSVRQNMWLPPQAQQPYQQPYQPQPFDHSQLFQQQNGLLGQNQFSRPQGNSQFGHQQGNSQFGQGQNQFGRQQVDLEQLKRGR